MKMQLLLIEVYFRIFQINSPMFKMDLAGSATADQKQRAVVAAAAAAAAAAAVHQQLDDTNAASVRHHQKRNRTFIGRFSMTHSSFLRDYKFKDI